MNEEQIVVIGGGAAGFFAAITCAEAAPDRGVLILEKDADTLAKVRRSGGGRCNLTNAREDPAELAAHYPRGGRALRGPFTRFGSRETKDWFAARGVPLKTEPDGRVFPASDKAETVVTCLTRAAAQAGVRVRTGVEATAVRPVASGFQIAVRGADFVACRQVLLAPGGGKAPCALAAGLGHTIAPPVPSLFALKVTDPRLKDLAGVTIEHAAVRLGAKSRWHEGSLVITHTGLSGPAALHLSAWEARALHEADYRGELHINWLGGLDPDAVRDELRTARTRLPRRGVATFCPFAVPGRLWGRLAAAAGFDRERRWADLSNEQARALAGQLTRMTCRLTGRAGGRGEFVTCGGVRLDEVDLSTMQSKRHAGLFFAGEILDIDAVTGGFNFQAAWTTGSLAGAALAAGKP